MARRLLISAFLVVHICATVVWVLPSCPLKVWAFESARCYLVPLGLWQYWGMFCPDPPQNILALEAEAIDTHGLRYNFAFPKQSDYSVWQAIPRYRHPKFAMNLAADDPTINTNRVFAARHVIRRLGLPAEAFPVDVRLVFRVQPCPPPGTSGADLPAPRPPWVIGTFRFRTISEVRP